MPGNSLATENQTAQKIWITETIRILRAIFSKQNCLETARQERVGINNKSPESSVNRDFPGFFMSGDNRLITGFTESE